MKILHIIPSYLPATRYGGPVQSVHGLCRALVSLGHEIQVLTTNVNGVMDSDVPLNTPVKLESVWVRYFKTVFPRRLYRSTDMGSFLGREGGNFDIFHLHSIYLWPTWVAGRIARRKGIPYIISPRGMLDKKLIEKKNRWIKQFWIRCIERHNIEHASALHMTSAYEEAEALRLNICLPKAWLIPNGVEIEDFQLAPEKISSNIFKLLGKKNYLLFLGRIHWKKGLDRLILALRDVPKAHLIIAGNDEENYRLVLDKIIHENQLGQRITFAGPVYGADKVALLKNAAIFILPSHSENFGNAVLEAMAVGCPVIVTPEVGLADTVRKEGAGWVVENHAGLLAQKISELLSKPSLREQMGQRGARIVRERFTWNVVAAQMEKAYRSILSAH